MHVRRLELTEFRNYESLTLEPHSGLNVLVGQNAQGKSNVLESLYALATTKSLRTNRDTEMVRFGAELARAVAVVHRERQGDVLLELAIAAAGAVGERKSVRVNRSKQSRIADSIGQLNVVLFSSLDMDIVRGEPDERRRFLNYEIAQVSPRYVIALASYRRALEQRNRLLREIRLGYSGGGDAGHMERADRGAWVTDDRAAAGLSAPTDRVCRRDTADADGRAAKRSPSNTRRRSIWRVRFRQRRSPNASPPNLCAFGATRHSAA